jgi:UDP-N-acetylmuramyl tripeptide synthase
MGVRAGRGRRPQSAMSAFGAKLAAARAVGRLARAAGRGGGTSLPGKVLTRLEPNAIARLAARLPDGSAVISATNGKTTTAAMAAAILEHSGRRLVHNRAGANMASGVASTLSAAAGRGQRIDGELGLFEVDEFWLDQVAPALAPRSLALGNLFRDQLDRYGELETIADRWAAMVGELPASAQLALNADDPLIADLGRARDPGRVTYFGVEDGAMAVPEMQHASDSKHCRRCGAAYVYDAVYLGHLGVYRCAACGRRRPEPAVRAEQVRLQGTDGATFTLATPAARVEVALPLPGLYNVYNALAAAALCLTLGVSAHQVAQGLAQVSAAFGRGERVRIGDRTLSLLLIKNPAGTNEILRTLRLAEPELDLLGVLNDRTADGHDISWVWDADFELLADRARRITCAGTRAAELALRLKYAGVDETRLRVIPELPAALDDALAGAAGERVFALPTYTALLELHAELERRGHVKRFWAGGRR